MGEVFVAEDTRLHRKVALKLLSGLTASDPERRERFKREAQAIAALNHPREFGNLGIGNLGIAADS